MKHKKLGAAALVAATLAIAFLLGSNATAPTTEAHTETHNEVVSTSTATSTSPTPTPKPKPVRDLAHQKEVWLYALEWCESNGNNNAINPKDRDGTPSYGAFQFKPSTFKGYAAKYKMFDSQPLDSLVMNYAMQRAIVARMIDDPTVRWSNEFPACSRKIGLPPR